MDNENNIEGQTIKQRMMIVSSQYPDVVLELIKNSAQKGELVGDTEYATVVNAITFDVQSSLILKVSKLMEDIKGGSLFNTQ